MTIAFSCAGTRLRGSKVEQWYFCHCLSCWLHPASKVLAKELSKDKQVMLDGKTKAKLTFVERLKPTMVLKISFRPDLAVRAFMVPPAILSKGSRKRNFRRGNNQGEAGDAGSDPESDMPNTYRSY